MLAVAFYDDYLFDTRRHAEYRRDDDIDWARRGRQTARRATMVLRRPRTPITAGTVAL